MIRVFVGVVLALAGVALTVGVPNEAAKVAPTLLVIAAGFALAVGSVLVKRHGPFEPLKLMAWMSLFTVPQLMSGRGDGRVEGTAPMSSRPRATAIGSSRPMHA